MDSVYLKNTVASELAKGVAEVCIHVPDDPVEYLALWLLHQVDNVKIAAAFEAERKAAELKLKADQEKARLAIDAAKNESDAKMKALEHLKTLHDDPFELMQAASDAVKKFTGCANSYVALLEEPEPEEPDEDDEEEEGEPEPEPEPAEEDEDGEPKELINGFNYDEKYFKYVAASEQNKFLIGQKLEPEQGPTSYQLVTAPAPCCVDVPNCLEQEGLFYFKDFARAGAYFSAAIILKSGERLGMVCADTLKSPEGGSGRKFVDDDKDYIELVAKAIAAALDLGEELRAQQAEAAGDLDALQADAENAVEEESQKEEAAKVAEETILGEGEEPAEGAEPPEPPAEVELTPEEKAVKEGGKKLKAVNNLLGDLKANALAELKSYPRAPKHTYKVLKAILLILGHSKKEMDEWNKARKLIDQGLINKMRGYDAEGPRNAAAWKGVRVTIKGLEEADVAKESKAGAILYKWVLAVKQVSDDAVALRKAKGEEGGEAPAEAEAEAES